MSILGRFDTVLIEPTLVVEQVDNEVQPILLELSSSIENSRDLDQHQRFGVACMRQAMAGIRNGSHSQQSYCATEQESWILPN